MTIHEFDPGHYHRTIGSHEPVLRIRPGDTVITRTVDAGGSDRREERVTPGGNPQTGPFWVAGAEPGDTLVVELVRVEPDRRRGYAGNLVAANILDPEYVRSLPESRELIWLVDMEAGTAKLEAPPIGLERLALPLDPMVGCFGVAPSRGQAISTATSAEHGGNMDYRGFKAGVTAYFPVFVPGALFHLGDVHALQGDGEIVGSGVEISATVEFTVQLRKEWPIQWPRGENQDAMFTCGNARPLDQAVQHATTEMLRWLDHDYGLDAAAAGTLLGQCVEYDVGNVYDPAYTMICKVPKAILKSLA
ncbi:MAG: acetamidase/formamidase family protein [Thermaerobacterales bacterium]